MLDSMMSQNFGDGSWSCSTCGKTMPAKKDMRRHCETHVDMVMDCPICQKSFKTSNAFRQHQAMYHKQ